MSYHISYIRYYIISYHISYIISHIIYHIYHHIKCYNVQSYSMICLLYSICAPVVPGHSEPEKRTPFAKHRRMRRWGCGRSGILSESIHAHLLQWCKGKACCECWLWVMAVMGQIGMLIPLNAHHPIEASKRCCHSSTHPDDCEGYEGSSIQEALELRS